MEIPSTAPLFAWGYLEDNPSLHTVKELLRSIPDGALLDHLRERRGRGRNKYPVDMLWGTLLLTIVLRHVSVEACLCELRRNTGLRLLIGIQTAEDVPKAQHGSRAAAIAAATSSRCLSTTEAPSTIADSAYTPCRNRVRARRRKSADWVASEMPSASRSRRRCTGRSSARSRRSAVAWPTAPLTACVMAAPWRTPRRFAHVIHRGKRLESPRDRGTRSKSPDLGREAVQIVNRRG